MKLDPKASNGKVNRTLLLTNIAFGLLGLLAMVAGCGHEKNAETTSGPSLPVATVRVEPVASSAHTSTELVTGTIRSKLRATLEAKVSGRITELPVSLGQEIKSGELLARLDAAEIRARVQQAEATLQQAERDWKRTSALFEQQAATRSEYDVAESRLQVAKAALDEAKAMSAYIEVTAPFTGVITRKYADRGDLALPGKPLVALEDPSALQMEADVPEAISAQIKKAAKMQILFGAGDQSITGEVSEIAPTADPETRTCKVKLDIPPGKEVMPGQFARLVVPIGERQSIRIPASAVVQRGQMEIVFVAADQRARMHLVKTGRQFGQTVEILSGLDSGDQVVVEGAPLLQDGQPVELK